MLSTIIKLLIDSTVFCYGCCCCWTPFSLSLMQNVFNKHKPGCYVPIFQPINWNFNSPTNALPAFDPSLCEYLISESAFLIVLHSISHVSLRLRAFLHELMLRKQHFFWCTKKSLLSVYYEVITGTIFLWMRPNGRDISAGL